MNDSIDISVRLFQIDPHLHPPRLILSIMLSFNTATTPNPSLYQYTLLTHIILRLNVKHESVSIEMYYVLQTSTLVLNKSVE